MKKTKIPKDKVNLILDLKKSGVSNIDVLNVIEKTDRSFFIDPILETKIQVWIIFFYKFISWFQNR